METAAPTIRALDIENQKLRADLAELVDTLRETRQRTLLVWIAASPIEARAQRRLR